MDVVNAEQAKIAEKAGAVAVMVQGSRVHGYMATAQDAQCVMIS